MLVTHMDKLFEERYREAGPGWRPLARHTEFRLQDFQGFAGVKVIHMMFDLKVKESEGLKVRRFKLEIKSLVAFMRDVLRRAIFSVWVRMNGRNGNNFAT